MDIMAYFGGRLACYKSSLIFSHDCVFSFHSPFFSNDCVNRFWGSVCNLMLP